MTAPESTPPGPSRSGVRPSAVRAWFVTMFMMLLLIVNFGDKSVLGLAATQIKDEFGLSASTYGAISSSTFFLFSIASLAVGLLTTRLPVKWVLVGLSGVWALVQLPVVFAAGVGALWFSRIALGAAEGPTTGLVTHATQMWFPPEKRSIPTGLCTIGAQIGSATAAPLLTWCIVYFGWRSAFLALCVVGLLISTAWAMVGADGPYDGSESDPARRSSSAASEPHVPYRRLFTSGTFLGTVISGFTVYWAGNLTSSWLPLYLEDVRGYSPLVSGSLVGIPPLVGAVGVLAGTAASGWLIRRGVSTRWARGVLAATIVILTGGCQLGFAASGQGWWTIVLMSVGFSLGTLAFPLNYAGLSEIAPVRQRGFVLGATLAVITSAGLVAPYLTGVVVDSAPNQAAGFFWCFTGLGLVTIASGILALLIVRPNREAPRFGMPSLVQPRPRTLPEGSSR